MLHEKGIHLIEPGLLDALCKNSFQILAMNSCPILACEDLHLAHYNPS